MNKKTLIALCITVAVLLGGIVGAMMLLYGGSGDGRDETEPEAAPIQEEAAGVEIEAASKSKTPRAARADISDLLLCVPEDAALVMCGPSIGRLQDLLTDTTKVYGALLFDSRSAGFPHFLADVTEEFHPLRDARYALSLHYGGNMVPLLVADASHLREPSALDSLARSFSLVSRIVRHDSRQYLAVSTSESLINSSERHLAEGGSILDDEDFRLCLEALEGRELILWSGIHSGKLLPSYATRTLSTYASFLKRLGSWGGVSIEEGSDKRASLTGVIRSASGEGSALRLLSAGRKSAVQAARVLPCGTVWAVDLPLSDPKAYYRHYIKYLDACMKLPAHKDKAAALKASTGVRADDWVEVLSPKEIVQAQWRTAGGELVSANFLRSSKLRKYDTGESYAFSGYASHCFGEAFALDDESVCAKAGGWLISGSAAAVADALKCIEGGDTVGDGFPEGQYSAVLYADLGLCELDAVLRQPLLGAVKTSLLGSASETAVATLDGDKLSLEVVRHPTAAVRKDAAPSTPTYSIDVPKGPWKVTNSATGKQCTLYQNSHLSICLQDENGKDVWGVPFKYPICGCVEEIDYYANGKIQFLFAAGSSLYLMDRLSRTVKGFPVDLGKEVLLGPAVYDFTGAHGYTAMVLHRDNTIGMYNLHGKAPEQWKGIAPEEMISGLPELCKIKGERYWLVPTVQEKQLYPFYGGDRIKEKKILNQIKDK